MYNMNSELLYDAFNRYYERGITARDAGDIFTAKAQLLLAAETLRKLADLSSGNLKRTRQQRVIKILELIENLNISNSNPNGVKTSLNKSVAGSIASLDNTETDWVSATIPDMGFSKVAGLETVKQAARDMIIDPFKCPDLYEKHGLKSGGGIMMYGLPGTGKTTVAKAIAGEVEGKFYNVKCSDIFSKWVGEAERNIRNLFAVARSQKRAVIFFDDCDAISGGRSEGSDVTGKKVLTELLVQLDGVESDNTNLLLLAATNAPWNVDSALTRTGRFDYFIEIPLPDEVAREFLIKREFKFVQTDVDIDIAEMVYYTKGYSGADIVGVCNYTKRLSLQRDKVAREQGEEENSIIMQEDITEALKNISSSIKKTDLIKLAKFKLDNSLQ